MAVEFFLASNGEKTCKINNFPLHSSYNPLKEAERYVANATPSFNPKFILVIEPALSYCINFFRKLYPDSKLCCVRLCNYFSDSDFLWDKVFYFYKTSSLYTEIFNYMGDEGIIACFFWSWPASQTVFKKENNAVWEEIKKTVLKTKSILNTRKFFAKRWAKNALRFCLFSNYNAYILKGDCPVLICASGPSLKSSIPFIKKYREKFFLAAVSSALSPLIEEEVIPDICISTDGGYYAKAHLAFALKKHNIPLVLSPEGACYGDILNKGTIVPASYGDGVAEKLISKFNYINIKALRNGTVSGTAADFALNITNDLIFFCGLDLSPSKGFCHTQPNELEINECIHDTRLRTLESRIAPSTFYSPSLEIYKNWFSTSTFFKRVYRLSNNFEYENTLGEIEDVNWDFFEAHAKKEIYVKPSILYLTHNIERNDRIRIIINEVWNSITDSEWIKNILPAEDVLFERAKAEEKEELSKKIKEGMEAFAKEIQKQFEKGFKS